MPIAEAKAGRVPVDVYWQVQTQLLVSGARLVHLYVFEGTTGILLKQKPEPEAWETLRRGWDRFMGLVRTDQPPPLTEGDTVIRRDAEWLAAAEAYLECKLFADQAAKALAEAKERLVGLISHTSETGGGVTVTRYMTAWRRKR